MNQLKILCSAHSTSLITELNALMTMTLTGPCFQMTRIGINNLGVVIRRVYSIFFVLAWWESRLCTTVAVRVALPKSSVSSDTLVPKHDRSCFLARRRSFTERAAYNRRGCSQYCTTDSIAGLLLEQMDQKSVGLT